MAARELRYKWFDEMASAENCQAIVVAHHQNDQAETILLNLRRGTGIRGLIGMRPISSNPIVPDSTIPIVRPLLCTTRDYIEYYLRYKRHMEWVDDSTNTDTTITRNAIRKQLQSYTKAEIEHMAQTAEYMQGYLDIIEGRETREAGITKLYEELRQYGFGEQRGTSQPCLPLLSERNELTTGYSQFYRYRPSDGKRHPLYRRLYSRSPTTCF
jgi:tRNA(Ile)-lysidine synthase TilS/MesJ